MSSLVGTTINGYRIDQRLGMGGMAKVYKAHHHKRPGLVCIKILQADPHDPAGFSLFARLFEQEAEVLASLKHPNIMRLFDYGTRLEDGLAYLVMEYAEGGNLAAVLHRTPGPLPYPYVTRIVDQVATGLDYAHSQQVLHRDLKPQNILCHNDGRWIIADFGLVKTVGNAVGSAHITKSGIVGTAAYLAPEQYLGRLDYRSDFYSLGIMTYQLFAGRLPFEGDAFEMIYAHLQQAPPALRERNIHLSPAVEAVLFKMLSKDAEERYPSALAFAHALHQVVHSGK